MADLVSAIIAASKRVADPRVAAYTSGNRPYLVRITRLGTRSTFDRDSRAFGNQPDQVLYEGPARIYPGSGGVEMDIGDERTSFTSTRASIDATGVMPRIDDQLQVLDDPGGLARSTEMLGRIFMVTDVAAGGHFDVGYTLSLSGVAPSRRT